MPCRSDCHTVSYVCGCKLCIKIRSARETWWKSNNVLQEKMTPQYLRDARKAMGDIDGPIIFISDEAGKLEMDIFGKYGEWPSKLKEWLERCRPFPEQMTFEKLSIKNAPVLYTTHKHTKAPAGSECDECKLCSA